MLGVYVHIPFCERKCNYCAFSSFVASEGMQAKYIDSLIQEIDEFGRTHKEEKYKNVDTIFLGGGTPNLLSTPLLEKLISKLKEAFDLHENLEFTIECNPNSLNFEKLESYKKMGINRISIGVQSLEDEQLKFIGRLHDKNQALKSIQESLSLFDDVSVDLLIGIKGMEKEGYIKSLESLSVLGVKHFSTYMLQVEDGTPLAKLTAENKGVLPDDEDCIDIYNETVKFLKSRGYNQYEVSNFAQNGFECKHNLKYWTGEDYIGFGLAAHSYINGRRFANAKTFEDYYNKKLALQEKLTTVQLIEEHIMLGLRCDQGVNLDYLASLGYNLAQNEHFDDFVNKNVLQLSEDGKRAFLNPEFYGVNNYIIVHLLQN